MATTPNLGDPTAYVALVDNLVYESTSERLSSETKELAAARIMDMDSPLCALHEIYVSKLEGDPDALPYWAEAFANLVRLLPLPMDVIQVWTRNVNSMSFVVRLNTLFTDSRPYAPQHDLEDIDTEATLPPILTENYSNQLGKRKGEGGPSGSNKRRREE